MKRKQGDEKKARRRKESKETKKKQGDEKKARRRENY